MGFDIFNVTGDKGWLTQGVDMITGKTAADNQQKAAKQAMKAQAAEAEKSRAFLQQQATQGQGFIDTATGQAAGALGTGQSNALNDLQSARGSISGQPDRLGALYDGGLAAGFQTDPGYQFRQQQGEQAINRSAAARGGRLAPGTLQRLLGFNQDLASQEFGNYAQRQMGLAGAADQSGMQRGNALAGLFGQQAGMQQGYGGNLANLFSGAGTNKANIGMGAASGNTGISQGLMGTMGGGVPFAGGGAQAQSNFYGGALATGAGKLFDWFTSPSAAPVAGK